MGFPFANPWTNKVVNVLPYLMLIALFGVAIWAQRHSCDGDLFRAIEALPGLLVPQGDRAWLRG